MERDKTQINEVKATYAKLPFEDGDDKLTYKQRALEFFLLEQKKFQFQYDIIRNRILVSEDGDKFKQMNENRIWRLVQREHAQTSMEYLLNNICSPDIAKEVNPLKIWLEGLKFDEKDHIQELATYIKFANDCDKERDRFYSVLKKWLVGAVRCLYDPFYVHKQSLILQGPSGIGKTPFLLSLLPRELIDFVKYAPCFDPKSKDAQIALTTSWVILIDEIDDFFKNKENRDNYKSVMTQFFVNVRLPYGKTEVCRPRIASILGTCNESTFLNDETGTQRFSVFEILQIENRRYGTEKYVEDFDMTNLWAQVYHLYKSGFNPEYTHKELVDNEEANELFKYNSPEYEAIVECLTPANKEDYGAYFMTSSEICRYLNEKQTAIRFANSALGRALIRMGFKKVNKKINGRCIRGYYVRCIDLKQSELITPQSLKSLNS